jgi:hypothetical protein
MQDRVIRFIVEHSQVTEQKLRELMFRTGELMRDVGTVLVGTETVEVGLMDAVGGVENAVAKLLELIAQSGGELPRTEEDYLEERGEVVPAGHRPPSAGGRHRHHVQAGLAPRPFRGRWGPRP